MADVTIAAAARVFLRDTGKLVGNARMHAEYGHVAEIAWYKERRTEWPPARNATASTFLWKLAIQEMPPKCNVKMCRCSVLMA
jgi:hypothetical protein